MALGLDYFKEALQINNVSDGSYYIILHHVPRVILISLYY